MKNCYCEICSYADKACSMAVTLATELLANPPNLMEEVPPPIVAPLSLAAAVSGKASSTRKKKKSACTSNDPLYIPHPKAIEISRLASETLRKAKCVVFGFRFYMLDSGLVFYSSEIV